MARASAEGPAYTSYVAARWASLYRIAYLIAGDPDEAEDLLQATLVKAYVKWEQVCAAASVDAYVRKMLVNELLGERRTRARRQARQHLVTVTDATTVEDPAERMTLWTHLSALPPRQRAVLVLRYYEDLSEEQIADVLGCSRGTVKSQAHDALRTLRTRLEAEEVPR